ncbi:MAG TPA: polyprenyl synthetase family protein [Bacteroidales bacterium]|nr:polyprenyl synthetase family protein [Bacteroidales bacterium]HPT20917.1 polyprenyl synthetase family protein [Bacteroidales bacterium]
MYNPPDLKELVDRAIGNLSYNQEAGKLIDPVKYILSMGGKRLRPVLTLITCNLFSDKIDEAVMPAVGLEVFHNFTLVHDDIIDQALVRRNMPTIHSKWNVNQAILSGDVMAFVANECILQTPSRCLQKVFKIFNKAAIEVCVGQQLDIDFEKTTIVSKDEYLRMIELKTGALMATSAKIGAVIGGAEDKDAELLYDFGRNLGMAFQMQDDILDAYGDVKVFGKVQGNDIVSNKKTFLLVKALEIASVEQFKQLQEQFTMKEFDPEKKVRKVMELYDQLNIKSITENQANDYINNAFGLLEKIGVSKERKLELAQVANSLVGRNR